MYHLEKKKDKLIKTSIINTLVKQAFSLMIIMATILFNIFGIFKFGWSFNEMSANFLFAGILAA